MQPIYDEKSVRTLRDYLDIIRRRWPILVGLGLLGAVALVVLGAPRGETSYRATATLIANPSRSFGQGYNPDQVALLATNGTTREGAEAALGGPPPCAVSASGDIEVGSVSIRATGTDADGCAATAAAYAQSLLDFFAAEDKAEFDTAFASAQAGVSEAKQALDVAQAAVRAVPEDEQLAAERDAALSRYTLALQNLQAVGDQSIPDPLLRLVDTPTAQVDPPPGLAGQSAAVRGLLGLMLGLMAGFGVAMVLDSLDRRIRTADRAASAFGYPVLAEVPKLKALAGDGLSPPDSPVMEAFRRVRTMVLLEVSTAEAATPTGPRGHVVLVGSPGPREGKTTTAAHLIASLAESGMRVLAVNADFRKPRLHKLLGEPSGDKPRGEEEAGSWIIRTTGVEGVDLVSPRQVSSDSTRLLRDIGRMLEVAREGYDMIVIDTAPILVANDVLELIPFSDLVILVARARQTRHDLAFRAASLVNGVEANVLGVILNAVTQSESYAYYGGRYGYYTTRPSPPAPLAAPLEGPRA